MPEYLHPGVYIEETSFRGKPIEGVSTSTAGLVGRCSKGPEGKPTLVTSFAQYVREFGPPPPAGALFGAGDFLGHSVKAFFENGGRRAYIVRALPTDGSALHASAALRAGVAATMPTTRVLREGDTTIQLTSLRGIENLPFATFRMFVRPDATSPWNAPVTLTVNDLDEDRSTVALTAAITLANLGGRRSVTAANVYFDLGAADVPVVANAPTFRARYRGGDGNALSIMIRPSDRPAVAVTATTPAAPAAASVLAVATTAGFYTGAIVEVCFNGTTHAKDYRTVLSVNHGARTIELSGTSAFVLASGPYVRTLEMDILVLDGGAVRESFTGQSWNPAPGDESFARYYFQRINDPVSGSRLVTIPVDPNPPADPTGAPTTINGVAFAFGGGSSGNPLTPAALIGTDGGPGNRTGIEALREREDIALVAVPGVVDEAVQSALITHCELLKYRFAVLDGPRNEPDVTRIQAHRNQFDTKYAGMYTPWLETLDLATGRQLVVPPSGHVLGICARVDNERGVHKAPANEVVRGITDVELPFGDGEQDVLNPAGVNLIREFEGRGIRVWGGRTMTSDQEWKYVNVRRLFIFLEHSIDRGSQWVVFEPNTESLWQRVVSTIESFLFGVWKSGALMGVTPEEAYFVRCDRTTMTQDDIDNGRLVCLIGVAPAYPAEFVIFRIGQFTASTNRA